MVTDDLVKRICQQWIDAGGGNDCFWVQWSDCPSGEDSLTPSMVLDHIEKLEAKLRDLSMQELTALGQAHDAHQGQLEAEAKLAKAVTELRKLGEAAKENAYSPYHIVCHGCSDTHHAVDAIIAELTGGKDE